MEELNIDMVRCFLHDYLHVVLLGCFKRLMKTWMSGKLNHRDLSIRLCSRMINMISNKLILISNTQPNEFQRRSRSLNDFAQFKATEFRTILLYSGPVIFKNALPIKLYEHFLLLHVAISILCSEKLCHQKSEIAKLLLRKFVEQIGELYGTEELTYNVHALLHLEDDVKIYGPLDRYSCFSFESFNYKLKRMIKLNNVELPQISNRISEMSFNTRGVKKNNQNYPIVTKKIKKSNKFRKFKTENFEISNGMKNKWLLTPQNSIVKYEYFQTIEGEDFIYGSEIKEKFDFYELPIKSSKLNIYKTTKVESPSCFWKYSSRMQKLFCIEWDSMHMVFFPLIHS